MIESVTSVRAGHEGASAAFWSNGLKSQVGIDEVSDEVLADEPSCGSAGADDYRGLGVVRGNDARAELLDVAEEGFAGGGAHEAWRRVQLLLAALRL